MKTAFWQKTLLIFPSLLGLIFTPWFAATAQESTRPESGINVFINQSVGNNWFIKAANPGQTVEGQAVIVNNNPTDTTVELTLEDGASELDGGFVLLGTNQQKEITTWGRLEQNQITLPARKGARVKFFIQIPFDAKPGEYAGAVVGSEVPKAESASGHKIVTKIGARIYITVKGNLRQNLNLVKKGYEIDKDKNLYLKLTLKNDGNVRSDPVAHVWLFNFFTKPVKADLGMPQLSPGREANAKLLWPRKIFPWGPQLAFITISDSYWEPEGVKLTKQAQPVRFSISTTTTWGWVLSILLIALAVWYYFYNQKVMAEFAAGGAKVSVYHHAKDNLKRRWSKLTSRLRKR